MKVVSKTRFNLAHQRMIAAVIAFCLSPQNIVLTQTVAAFYNLMISVLQVNLTAIVTLRALIAQPITGYAALKKALKSALVVITAVTMRAVYSYAVAAGDTVLASKMRITRSKLNKMSYEDFVSFVQGAINIVNPLLGSLGSYNVTSAVVTAWQTLLTQLVNVLSDPKNAISNRSAINKEIQNLIRQCMLTLYDQCDTLVDQVQNETYINSYKSNRRLDDRHIHTKLRAYVEDELQQGQPNADVIVGDAGVTGTTDENGYVLIEGIPFDEPMMVTVITGTNSKTFGPFTFKKGKSLTEHFVVTPAFAKPASKKAAKATVQK